LIQAASKLVSILNKPLPSTIPTLEASNEICDLLLKLVIILKRVEKFPGLEVVEEVVKLAWFCIKWLNIYFKIFQKRENNFKWYFLFQTIYS